MKDSVDISLSVLINIRIVIEKFIFLIVRGDNARFKERNIVHIILYKVYYIYTTFCSNSPIIY